MCVHFWLIESNTSPESLGRCKHCLTIKPGHDKIVSSVMKINKRGRRYGNE